MKNISKKIYHIGKKLKSNFIDNKVIISEKHKAIGNNSIIVFQEVLTKIVHENMARYSTEKEDKIIERFKEKFRNSNNKFLINPVYYEGEKIALLSKNGTIYLVFSLFLNDSSPTKYISIAKIIIDCLSSITEDKYNLYFNKEDRMVYVTIGEQNLIAVLAPRVNSTIIEIKMNESEPKKKGE